MKQICLFFIVISIGAMDRCPRWGTKEWTKAREEIADTIRNVERREAEKAKKIKMVQRILRERARLSAALKKSRENYNTD